VRNERLNWTAAMPRALKSGDETHWACCKRRRYRRQRRPWITSCGLSRLFTPIEEEQMAKTKGIAPCLWFDTQAEEAARYYTGIFKDSRIVSVTHYGHAGYEAHHRPAGSVMAVAFELNGQPFTALNAGPQFKFNEAISFYVNCADQEEIDYYWDKLSAGGDPKAQMCGWLKDKYGVSWQIVPENVYELYEDAGSPPAEATMEAMLKMKKIDMEALQRAHDSAHEGAHM
jgi:predicted 3-demethylubiquinone-9 3-methyltransferase (glyoxalase superfamily)